MKYIIRAHRSAQSVCGAASAIAKIDGKPAIFDTKEAADAQRDAWTKGLSTTNVWYTVEPHDGP